MTGLGFVAKAGCDIGYRPDGGVVEASFKADDRDAVYFYLEAVFALVTGWQRPNCSLKKSRATLRLKPQAPKMKPEPFARVIFCTCDIAVVEAKTRSKWSRVLRFARKAKPGNQRLTEFIKANGGINACARMFAGRTKDLWH